MFRIQNRSLFSSASTVVDLTKTDGNCGYSTAQRSSYTFDSYTHIVAVVRTYMLHIFWKSELRASLPAGTSCLGRTCQVKSFSDPA